MGEFLLTFNQLSQLNIYIILCRVPEAGRHHWKGPMIDSIQSFLRSWRHLEHSLTWKFKASLQKNVCLVLSSDSWFMVTPMVFNKWITRDGVPLPASLKSFLVVSHLSADLIWLLKSDETELDYANSNPHTTYAERKSSGILSMNVLILEIDILFAKVKNSVKNIKRKEYIELFQELEMN